MPETKNPEKDSDIFKDLLLKLRVRDRENVDRNLGILNKGAQNPISLFDFQKSTTILGQRVGAKIGEISDGFRLKNIQVFEPIDHPVSLPDDWGKHDYSYREAPPEFRDYFNGLAYSRDCGGDYLEYLGSNHKHYWLGGNLKVHPQDPKNPENQELVELAVNVLRLLQEGFDKNIKEIRLQLRAYLRSS